MASASPTSPLALHRVHYLDAERPSLRLLDGSLLISYRLNEKLAAHDAGLPNIVQRLHSLAEGRPPYGRVQFDIDLDATSRPCYFR